VTIHNESDDDSPFYSALDTDLNGNTGAFSLDNGTYYVRASKAGYVFVNSTITVASASATFNITGTTTTITAPSDPTLCKLYFFPKTLSNAEITSLECTITSSAPTWVKSNDQLISKDTGTFTYDSSTTPDSFYFNIIQGVTAYVKCKTLGISEEITIPAETTKNLYDLLEET
jgi:hypothetical protein